MLGNKSILKKVDYDKMKIKEVNYLPLRFDGTRIFVLSPVKASSYYSKSKSIVDMDKRYDEHVWTKLTLVLLSAPPLALVTSNVRISNANTFKVYIAPLLSTT